MANLITQSELKERLHYDPETGLFVWLSSNGNMAKQGMIAGTRDKEGYITIGFNHKFYKSHRLAFLYMTGCWPINEVDHINHKNDDNKWSNLREATRQENNQNMPMRRDNKSGITGVRWENNEKRWVARIKYNGKERRLYSGFCKLAANICRKVAERENGFHINHGVKV